MTPGTNICLRVSAISCVIATQTPCSSITRITLNHETSVIRFSTYIVQCSFADSDSNTFSPSCRRCWHLRSQAGTFLSLHSSCNCGLFDFVLFFSLPSVSFLLSIFREIGLSQQQKSQHLLLKTQILGWRDRSTLVCGAFLGKEGVGYEISSGTFTTDLCLFSRRLSPLNGYHGHFLTRGIWLEELSIWSKVYTKVLCTYNIRSVAAVASPLVGPVPLEDSAGAINYKDDKDVLWGKMLLSGVWDWPQPTLLVWPQGKWDTV